MMIDLLQLLVYGVVLGCIVTLGAIGVSLVFGILGFANFAHGDLMTVGAYLALVFVGLGWPMHAAFLAALAGTAIAAVLIDQTLYRHLRRRSSVVLVISSLGVSLMLRSLIQLVWGPDNQVYQAGIQLPIDIAGLRIKPNQIVIVVGAVVLVTALHVFLSRTKMGKAMRATADNRDLAQTAGIDIGRVILWTWIIGALLAAAAGIFLAIDTRLHPFMGRNILLAIFAAAILGGIGKPYGAIAGGLTIGIAEEMSTLVLSPAYKSAVAFAIMVAMLIFRPTGLFGGR